MSRALNRIPEPDHSPDIALYNSADYFRVLNNDIDNTRENDRVALTTMGFDPNEPQTQSVLRSLHSAAGRNVTVSFGVDAFAILAPSSVGPLVTNLPIGRNSISQRHAALERLSNYPNVQCGLVNVPEQPTYNLFSGRSHIKLAVVNDRVYIGGPSFEGADRKDMAVVMEDKSTADWLYGLAVNIIDTGNTRGVLGVEDQIREVDHRTRLMIDAGVPGQSLIMDEAVELIDEAEEWVTIGGQYFPMGKIGEQLAGAIERGVDTYIAYNQPDQHDRLKLAHRLIMAWERLHRPPEFFTHQMPTDRPALHCKVIANENRALVGTHNYIGIGVKLGTSEIVIERRGTAFARAVHDLLVNEVDH